MIIRRVVGTSMYPALRGGRLIIARKKPVTKGDVVICKIGSREVIKRVTDVDDTGMLYIEGDNKSASTDSHIYGYVSPSAYLATVIYPRNMRRSFAPTSPSSKR